MTAKYSTNKSSAVIGRFFRFIFSVIILSAVVLGITMGVKSLYSSDFETILGKVSPLLARVNININEKEVGQVAGEFVERISQTNLGSGVSTSRDVEDSDNTISSSSTDEELFSIAILADIHEDTQNLSKALKLVKDRGIGTVILLGDETNYGDVPTLQKVKDILTNSGLVYYVLPGDHDLAQSVGTNNFISVFGKDYVSFDIEGIKFTALNNSYNYTLIPAAQMAWLEGIVNGTDFIFLSQPLFTKGLTPYFENIYMGSTASQVEDPALKEKQKDVKDQGVAVLSLLRQTNSVQAIFAGEHHKSSVLSDPTRTELKHYVVGAVSNSVNDYPQNVIQSPRFSILTVYQNGGYKVDEITL